MFSQVGYREEFWNKCWGCILAFRLSAVLQDDMARRLELTRHFYYGRKRSSDLLASKVWLISQNQNTHSAGSESCMFKIEQLEYSVTVVVCSDHLNLPASIIPAAIAPISKLIFTVWDSILFFRTQFSLSRRSKVWKPASLDPIEWSPLSSFHISPHLLILEKWGGTALHPRLKASGSDKF